MKKIILLTLFFIFGTLNIAKGESEMTEKQKSIVEISAFTANGNLEGLKESINLGLDSGLTVNEVKEIMVQLYAYCGFPRSLNALGVLSNTVDERKASGKATEVGRESTPIPSDRNSLVYGTQVQTEIVGMEVKGGIYEFAPMADRYLKAHLFGDIFGQDILDYRTRELVTVAALASMDGVNPQLQAHIGISRNVGVTNEELNGIVEVLKAKLGNEKADNIQQFLK
ncbi:carboxymuconolactone decarboxylase family protein [Fusobacterium mortiferum]|jgi:4-carboxymuconolactone decarboxylase|uniref:carboxymuconolactone decarboxylase family protein n=1 Tax=Fusobacterium mortiferum TaxID=850 RepID=UPI001F1DFF6B|nr:carboxymuconolactone decarboxylase family protein [Fusobacterium mortiferum]MCF2627496.1 carboxymuconolactone decarboxylase family protein [Fusobacterium mortiferum]MCF2698701.1 carboxymuconolactone decarboxylase family protein [Fusobacterium mortiferum]MCI7664970.1 carboxymuconolactone decarboxylase family protein [Fusobacterium mortiferum]MDY2802221.1 carboxymuconolactone decarboxylase family protein [Fusobacterium mortiferum]